MIIWILYIIGSFISGLFFGNGVARWWIDPGQRTGEFLWTQIVIPGLCVSASMVLQEMARKEVVKNNRKPIDKSLGNRDTVIR